jgi:hypothetical protein
VERDAGRAGLRELGDLALRPVDHEVDVDVDRVADVLAQRGEHERADGDRRDELAVHDVEVDDGGTGGDHLVDLRAEAGEVGRQDRRCDADFVGHSVPQTSISMLPPQALQLMIAVDDMRMMVECSPQSGQTERSSNRCRQ